MTAEMSSIPANTTAVPHHEGADVPRCAMAARSPGSACAQTGGRGAQRAGASLRAEALTYSPVARSGCGVSAGMRGVWQMSVRPPPAPSSASAPTAASKNPPKRDFGDTHPRGAELSLGSRPRWLALALRDTRAGELELPAASTFKEALVILSSGTRGDALFK